VHGKDLAGTQLVCDGPYEFTARVFDFKTENTGIFYEIKKDPKWYIEKEEFKYVVTPDYINMTAKDKYIPQLSRKTLKLNNTRQCTIVDLETRESRKIDSFVNFLMNDLKKRNEVKNKL
jgi:5-bromo-4-chloroindolyl phosphate hydrolysis protein